jgi:protein-S-isoprenylcysteine O-methyltransferase Ste14
MVLMILVIGEPWALWRWAAVAAGYVAVVLLTYLASRRIEERQLQRNIERCRSTSRFASTLSR